MRKYTPNGEFTDDRGEIRDLYEGQLDAVTRIRSNAGAVRGNHYHKLTTQWAYVLSGRLVVVTDTDEVEATAGEIVENPPGEPHAWRAVEDTDVIVFARGPRAGKDYESDTYRLEVPLIVPSA